MKKPDMTYALLFLSHTTLQSFVLYTKKHKREPLSLTQYGYYRHYNN